MHLVELLRIACVPAPIGFLYLELRLNKKLEDYFLLITLQLLKRSDYESN